MYVRSFVVQYVSAACPVSRLACLPSKKVRDCLEFVPGPPAPGLAVGEEELTPVVDLNVTCSVDPARVFSLPDGHLLVVKQQFLAEFLGRIYSAFAASAAPGTAGS